MSLLKKHIKLAKKNPIIGSLLAILYVTAGWAFHRIIYTTMAIPLSGFTEYQQNWIIFLVLIGILMLFGYTINKIIK